jgi:hypothetical protein
MWTFSGWSPDHVTLSDSDVTFTGTWIWTPLPVYTVTFTFVSGTSGRTLPDSVFVKAPDVHNRRGRRRIYTTRLISLVSHGRRDLALSRLEFFESNRCGRQPDLRRRVALASEQRCHYANCYRNRNVHPNPNHRDHARTYAATFLA